MKERNTNKLKNLNLFLEALDSYITYLDRRTLRATTKSRKSFYKNKSRRINKIRGIFFEKYRKQFDITYEG